MLIFSQCLLDFFVVVCSEWSDVKEAAGDKRDKWSSFSSKQKVREVVYYHLRLGRNDRTKKKIVPRSEDEQEKDEEKDLSEKGKIVSLFLFAPSFF